ncbi:hypothetical protein Pse7367_2787 [Thalassoporum mexicanum PCC 7367]|uniref:hypothetical protein n=1 Tax=Thalassoporum mexicanum TaxID=3457544 RepID=UPI00029FF1E4|nr:hypothetical protein [Pseudanabaena sp. PCC 7367]AFY71040.1 hypothetical protein Pse7367_2787 [Pseudanabaena sp. PCC 7367]
MYKRLAVFLVATAVTTLASHFAAGTATSAPRARRLVTSRARSQTRTSRRVVDGVENPPLDISGELDLTQAQLDLKLFDRQSPNSPIHHKNLAAEPTAVDASDTSDTNVNTSEAPAELVEAIAALDRAAASKDLDAVMAFYAADFESSDGLDKPEVRKYLADLWDRYKEISYTTEIKNWQRQDGQYRVETMTNISGSKQGNAIDGKASFSLEAKLSAVQTYQQQDGKWQLISQEILTEKSELTSGEEPPNIEVRLPDVIGVGREYTLDAILVEPLGASLLLGAVIEEPVNSNNYIKEADIDLEPLKAGGIFKIGQAPYRSGDRWISVILVRESGITIVSQRLQVRQGTIGNQYRALPDDGPVRSRVRPNPATPPTL